MQKSFDMTAIPIRRVYVCSRDISTAFTLLTLPLVQSSRQREEFGDLHVDSLTDPELCEPEGSGDRT